MATARWHQTACIRPTSWVRRSRSSVIPLARRGLCFVWGVNPLRRAAGHGLKQALGSLKHRPDLFLLISATSVKTRAWPVYRQLRETRLGLRDPWRLLPATLTTRPGFA